MVILTVHLRIWIETLQIVTDHGPWGTFKDFVSNLDLCDSFQERKKKKTCFTYSNAAGNIEHRIDYIFCSPYMLDIARKSYVHLKYQITKLQYVTLKNQLTVAKIIGDLM